MPVIFNPAPFVAAGVTLKLKREREEKRRQQQQNNINRCSTCYNADQDTTHKVACCNCCEDGSFYTRA